jgi:ribose transport system permease protein
LLALAAVCLFFAIADRWFADGTFATSLNFRTMTVQTCVVAVAALGMTLVIVAGGIDLSAGTALALCATTLAWGLREDVAHWAFHGDNFASASLRLEEAEKRLTATRRTGKASDLSALEANVDAARNRLVGLLQAKLTALPPASDNGAEANKGADANNGADANKGADSNKGNAKSNGPVAGSASGAGASVGKGANVRSGRPGARDPAAVIRGKLARLADGQPPLRVDPLWLEGVPNSSWSAPLAVLLAIATGVVTGLANGVLVSGLRIAPFVVTLGTMTIFLGLGNLLSGNVPIRPSFAQIPGWLADLDGNTPTALWLGFPTGVWLALLLAAAVAVLLRVSVFGRRLFAIGSNENAARLCGVRLGPMKLAIYSLAGGLFGIAGIYQFTRLSTGNPPSGLGLELEIIAAVVIGGGSLSGGRGAVLGTLAGAAMMAVIRSGCTQLGLIDQLQRIILGVIIIAAVTIDQIRQRRVDAGR